MKISNQHIEKIWNMSQFPWNSNKKQISCHHTHWHVTNPISNKFSMYRWSRNCYLVNHMTIHIGNSQLIFVSQDNSDARSAHVTKQNLTSTNPSTYVPINQNMFLDTYRATCCSQSLHIQISKNLTLGWLAFFHSEWNKTIGLSEYIPINYNEYSSMECDTYRLSRVNFSLSHLAVTQIL